MRWPALLLILLVTFSETFGASLNRSLVGNETPPCVRLQNETQMTNPQEPYEEQNVVVALLWEEPLGLAAAALLRATLLAAGYNPDLIQLYYYPNDSRGRDQNQLGIDSRAIMVEVVITAHLQMRLSPRAARLSACRGASYENTNALRKCDFMVPGTETDAIIYIPNEFNHTCAAQLIKNVAATSSARYDTYYLERSNLTDLVRSSNSSFFFYDTFNKSNPAYVETMRLPMNHNDTLCDPTLENIVLLKYSGGLLPETFVKFSPSINDLYDVMNWTKKIRKSNISDAACEWALHNKELFNIWRVSAVFKRDRLIAGVTICKTEAHDLKEYLYMMNVLGDYKNISVSTLEDKSGILIQVYFANCSKIHPLLYSWAKGKTMLRTIGMVVPDNIASKAELLEETFGFGLLRYDVSIDSSKVNSVAGNVKHIEVALRRLLADCDWQRLAIISETTQLAAALSTSLRASTTGLVVRDVNVESILDLPRILQKLLDANTRIFLVNTGANMAAAVLAAAKKLDISRDRGFVWIVREYDAADDATSVTRPYSVSCSWRGERGNDTSGERDKADAVNGSKASEKGMTDELALRMKLEERWRGRAWPLHAAPILDALLMLVGGIRQNYNSMTRSFDWSQESPRWNEIQRGPITGIKQNFTVNQNGMSAPLVYVEQWGSEPRPRLLATWRGGERREPAEACPAPGAPRAGDGSTSCLTPYGDPFQPSCRDIIWVPSVILATIVGTGLVIAAIWLTRLGLSIRDHRIETDFAKRMLARRERVFAALADHLVDRKALELFQELGTGRFGRVHYGVLRESDRQVVVAAKALREEASTAEESEFLKEACTLATLEHENIISFVGVCVVDGPPLLLMEHAFFGDLLHYLQARRCLADGPTNAAKIPNRFEPEEKEFISAKALTKLAQEALRSGSNCLVDERRCLKLADFGLARVTGTMDGEYACRRGLFPVLWMAPESLATGVSSAASDVWSFGVLVFELVTLGRRPFGAQPPPAVLRHVVAGGRPRLPWDASAGTRAVTRACWRREPEARPTAASLAGWLSTRSRALRPALVTELVDIDSLMSDHFNEPDLCSPASETLHREPSAPSAK